jgi:hypothetical protein
MRPARCDAARKVPLRAGASPAQMWAWGEPSRGQMWQGVSPVPAQMWQLLNRAVGSARFRCSGRPWE